MSISHVLNQYADPRVRLNRDQLAVIIDVLGQALGGKQAVDYTREDVTDIEDSLTRQAHAFDQPFTYGRYTN